LVNGEWLIVGIGYWLKSREVSGRESEKLKAKNAKP